MAPLCLRPPFARVSAKLDRRQLRFLLGLGTRPLRPPARILHGGNICPERGTGERLGGGLRRLRNRGGEGTFQASRTLGGIFRTAARLARQAWRYGGCRARLAEPSSTGCGRSADLVEIFLTGHFCTKRAGRSAREALRRRPRAQSAPRAHLLAEKGLTCPCAGRHGAWHIASPTHPGAIRCSACPCSNSTMARCLPNRRDLPLFRGAPPGAAAVRPRGAGRRRSRCGSAAWSSFCSSRGAGFSPYPPGDEGLGGPAGSGMGRGEQGQGDRVPRSAGRRAAERPSRGRL